MSWLDSKFRATALDPLVSCFRQFMLIKPSLATDFRSIIRTSYRNRHTETMQNWEWGMTSHLGFSTVGRRGPVTSQRNRGFQGSRERTVASSWGQEGGTSCEMCIWAVSWRMSLNLDKLSWEERTHSGKGNNLGKDSREAGRDRFLPWGILQNLLLWCSA